MTIDVAMIETPNKNKRRDLFQSVLSTSPKIDAAMPMSSSEIMFWKRALHNYVHIYIKNICEKVFSKTLSLNLTLALQAHFGEWRLMRFGKELFIPFFFLLNMLLPILMLIDADPSP